MLELFQPNLSLWTGVALRADSWDPRATGVGQWRHDEDHLNPLAQSRSTHGSTDVSDADGRCPDSWTPRSPTRLPG